MQTTATREGLFDWLFVATSPQIEATCKPHPSCHASTTLVGPKHVAATRARSHAGCVVTLLRRGRHPGSASKAARCAGAAATDARAEFCRGAGDAGASGDPGRVGRGSPAVGGWGAPLATSGHPLLRTGLRLPVWRCGQDSDLGRESWGHLYSGCALSPKPGVGLFGPQFPGFTRAGHEGIGVLLRLGSPFKFCQKTWVE